MLKKFDKNIVKKFQEFELLFHDPIKLQQNYNEKIQDISSNNDSDIKNLRFNQSELLEFSKFDNQQTQLKYIKSRILYNDFVNNRKISKFPPLVQIEPTSICNYRCIMCYQSDSTFSKKSSGHMGNMSLDLFKKVIDQCEGNVDLITLASRGEPTLNLNFSEMLRYMNGKFIGTKINTNASMLNEILANEILSSDVQTLVFSIDAANKEQYESIRVRGNFDKVLKNIKMFSEIKKKKYPKSKIITRVSGVRVNKNQKLSDLRNVFGDSVDAISFVDYVPWEDIYNEPINNVKESCSELWRRFFVWWDGKVNPCDFDYKSLLSKWDINKMSISDIWNSEEYHFLRRTHVNGNRKDLDPCKRCFSS
jgi:radical SAM protein with 4Fe4S-binding SPASM domain